MRRIPPPAALLPRAIDWGRAAVAALTALLLILGASAAAAAGTPGDTTDWQRLSPVQREALAPLKGEWGHFSPDRRRKWLNIASRYPAMDAQQRLVLQRRMVEWVHMTPRQRRLARENYLATGRAPLQSRRQAWERYQKLSPEQRRELQRQARRPPLHVHVERYGTNHHPRRRPAAAASSPPTAARPASAPRGPAAFAPRSPAASAVPQRAAPPAAATSATAQHPATPAAPGSSILPPAPAGATDSAPAH